MRLLKSSAIALLLIGLTQGVRAQIAVIDNFDTNVNYILNGVAGTVWDGIYLGAGEIAGATGTGNTPGSVSVADASITSNNILTVSSLHTDWEAANDDGFFLYKVISGDFDMSVHVMGLANINTNTTFNLPGLMVRAFGPGGAPAPGGLENSLLWARFNEFNNSNMRKNNVNGIKTDAGLGAYPNSNYWLRLERIGNSFNHYEKADEFDAWIPVGVTSRPEFFGLQLQVGIEHAVFAGGTTRTAYYEKFSLTATNVGPLVADPAPATSLTITNKTNSVDLAWTPGPGTDSSVVVMWTGPGVLKQAPANGFAYTGNAVFGSGNRLPAVNYYVVYSGAGTNVTVTNLAAGTNFNVAVFACNGTGSSSTYTHVAATGSFTTAGAPPPVASGNIRVDPATPALTNFTSLGEWNTDGNFEGWGTTQVSGAAVAGGVLSGTSSGNDSQVSIGNLVGGPDLDLGYNDQLEIRMQVPTNYAGDIQVYYGTTSAPGFSAARVITIASALIPKDGAFHVYRIDTGLEIPWRSFLRDLRIDPIDAVAPVGQAFAIDYVRVGDLAGEVYLPRYTTSNPAAGQLHELGQPLIEMTSKHFRFNWDPVVATHASWTANMPRGTLRNLEETWQVYTKVLGYREPSESWTPANRNGNKYKINVSTWHSGYWAGGEVPGSTAQGRLNITPDGLRVDPPGLVVPHELMHVFQFHQKLTGAQTLDGMWSEGHANYARERWIYFYRSILSAGDQSNIDANYIHSAHLIPGHGRDYYLSWPFFLYLDENPDNLPDLGDGTVANIWKTNTSGVYLYNTLDQQTAVTPLKDIVGYFARRELTFDYQNQSSILTKLDSQTPTVWKRYQLAELVRRADDTNWWRVPMTMAPMQAAYATHEFVPQGSGAGRVVTVNFHGLPDAVRGADWRAAFIVISDTGVERYTPLWNAGTNSVTLAANENRLYVSVAGTPNSFLFTGHDDLTYPYRSHLSKQRLHYEISVTGATPRESVNGSTAGMTQHANGGGWRAAGAVVDASAFLGPNTRVYNTAQVRGNARIEDYAVVSNAVQVLDNAVVSGHALLRNNAIIRDNAKVRDWGLVSGSAIVSDHGRVLDHAEVTAGTVTGYGIAKGSSILQGGLVSDFGVIEGDFMASRNVTNGFAFGHLPFTGVPDNWIRVAPNRQYADYEFAAANDSMARDQLGVNDIYLIGSPAWRSSDVGRPGTLAFNGVNQYGVLDKSLSDTAEISVTAWVRWDGGAANQPAWHFGSATNKCMYFTPNDGTGHAKFVIRNGGGDQTLTAPAALITNTWTHVVVTLSNSTTGRLYINGVLQELASITIRPEQLNAPNVNTASQHHYLARGADPAQPYYNGSLDSVMVYTKALTASEITALAPANQSPSFTGTVSNQNTPAGVTLTITNAATDPNLPWQTLAYSVVNGPAGAGIDPVSGVFTWRPATSQANSNSFVSLRVTDNGSPLLNANRTFFVNVPPLNPPTVAQPFMTNGQVAFQISGDFGPDYCIQTSTNLTDWVPVYTNLSPALPFTWVDTNSPALPAVFYRVRLLP